MKHTFELKMPKLFGKKKGEDIPEIITEMEVEEAVDMVVNTIPPKVLIGGVLVIGLTVGYLVGHRSGVLKGGNVFIFKD